MMISFKDYDCAYPGSISVCLVVKTKLHTDFEQYEEFAANGRPISFKYLANYPKNIWHLLLTKNLQVFVKARFLGNFLASPPWDSDFFGGSSLDSMSCCRHVASWLWNLCTT